MSQTVTRALEILTFIARAPRTLTEVEKHIGVHKSTALRLLQTLEHAGFARHLGNRYSLGFAVTTLAQQALDQLDARTIAHTHLARLAEQEGHTVHLAQLIGDEVVYIDKVEGDNTVAMGSRIGLPADGHTAGVAKVILAFQSNEFRDRYLGRLDFERHTDSTIVTVEALVSQLHLVREQGWAEDDGEKEDYINCVALPVRDASGKVNFGLSVTALRAKAPLADLRKRVPEIRRVANIISEELGWEGQADER